MIFDFRNIERKEVDGFKGGNGPFLTKLVDDGKAATSSKPNSSAEVLYLRAAVSQIFCHIDFSFTT